MNHHNQFPESDRPTMTELEQERKLRKLFTGAVLLVAALIILYVLLNQ